MTNTGQPNKFWCYTCKNQRNDPAVKKRYCSIMASYLPTGCWCTTWRVGCASHSDHQNQRETVLDELKAFCKEKGTNWAYDKWTMKKLIEYVELHSSEGNRDERIH